MKGLRSTRTHGRARARLLTAGTVGAVLAIGVGGLAACGADDRDMAEPSPSQTTTTSVRGAPSTGQGAGTTGTGPPTFQLATTAFAPDAAVPDRYTCKGMDASPELSWTNVPTGTVELALVMDDPDADGFVHWVIAGLDPTTTGIPENEVPAGAVEADNGFGDEGWAGPCPPEGTGVHHYRFQLVALGSPLGLEAGTDANAAAEAVLGGNILNTATLTGTVDAG
jgi:Raf kinase inhibitor-like YbhB/YbcL family protein